MRLRRSAYPLYSRATFPPFAESLEPRRLLAAAELAVDVDPRVVNGTPSSSNPLYLTGVGDQAFFLAGRPTGTTRGSQLWSTDGTPGGTVLLKEGLDAGSFSEPPRLATAAVGMSFYFVASPAGTGTPRLWRSNGTVAGTAEVAGSPIGPRTLVGVGDKLFFRGAFERLWVADNATGTARELAVPAWVKEPPSELVGVGGVCYFRAETPASGEELWRSDGTPGGTYQVADLRPGPGDSEPLLMTDVGGALMFTADDGASRNLYRIDQPGAAPRLVQTLYTPGQTPSADEAQPAALQGLFIFNGPDGLWRSDGTTEGTYRVSADVRLGIAAGHRGTAVYGGRLYFGGRVYGSPYDVELYVTDGTPQGTGLVKDVYPGGVSAPLQFTAAGGLLYFMATTPTGKTVFRTDGTAAGTVAVEGAARPDSLPQAGWMANLNGMLLFAGTDAAHGRELWKVVDDHAPAVSTAVFRPSPAPHSLALHFNEPLTRAPAAADVTVRNVSTGSDVPRSEYTATYDPATAALTVRFTAPSGGTLPNGNYRITLAAGSARDAAGNAMPAAYAFDFFALAGDVNRDRRVDSTDFALLAGNFGRSGMSYAQGDLNGDGKVDSADFALLAGNFGISVPAPTPSLTPAPASVVSPTPAPAPSNPRPRRAAPKPHPRRAAPAAGRVATSTRRKMSASALK